jgi:type I restriction-modification system DNA methylase subunit
MNKKTDCVSNSAIGQVIEKKVEEKVKELLNNTLSNKKSLILPSDPIKRDAVLQDYFKKLHDILWDRAGFNPEKAMEHLIFFFAYRLIEKQADSLSLPQECRWSFLSSKKNENDRFEVMKKGCISFQKNVITKPFFKKPEIDKVDIVFDIIEHINMIPDEAIDDTDTLGNIFEYMQSWGWATMGQNGQYFTNRIICRLAFKLAYGIKKTLRRKDGSLCTFADWFCGTGGFPAEYVKGVNSVLKDIDWEKEKVSICCQDQGVSNIANTLLNLLIMTGRPFTERIKQGNSFTDHITIGPSAPFKDYSIDYSFMNPPYAGSAFEYSKIVKLPDGSKSKKFIVNKEIQSIGIDDNVKVSAGTQLAMATLSEDGGICCIVLSQGFFFGSSKKCVELRKKIAEEYKIWYVVDIASGSFINTGTKTSMVVFQRGVGATEKVSFIGLDEEELVTATLDELRAKHYSLNYKQYLPQTAVEVEGFEMVKLGDIVSFKAEKSKKDKNSYTYIDIGSVDKGNFKVGEPIKKGDLPGRAQYNVNIGDILLGTVRPNLEHYLLITPQIYRDDLIVSNGFSIMRCNTTKVLPTYLYSILTLPSTTAYLTERATGTTYPVIDDSIIGAMEIPLPSLERQQIVEAIDGWTNLAQNEEVSLKMLEKQMMFQVKEMGRGKARVKLGEVCEISHGKRVTKKENLGTIYPVYGGGNDTFRTDTKNRDGFTCKVSRFGISEHNCVQNIYGDYWLMDSGFTVNGVCEKTIDAYIYYWLMQSKELVYQCGRATAQMNMDMDTFRNLEIPLPPLTEQQTLQSDFDEIRHKHAKISTYKAKAQEAIQRLIPGA